MDGGYPQEADIDTYLLDQGVEFITDNNPNYALEVKQMIYRLLKRTEYAAVLNVFCPSPQTFNVVGGKYLYDGEVKTFDPGEAVNPTDNDTTYIWLTAANAIGSGIDGDGWPVTEHVKLAEIDVDADGVITEIRDLRVQNLNITAAV
jgi:hypothetical protein